MKYNNLALNILQENNVELTTNAFISPIRISEIIKNYGITLKADRTFESVSGMYIPSINGIYIFVNANYHYNHMRFSMAHELAHHVLGHTSYISVENSTHTIEVEANKMAASILMPTIVMDELAERKLDIYGMAQWLRVSPWAAAIRCHALGLSVQSATNYLEQHRKQPKDKEIKYISHSNTFFST